MSAYVVNLDHIAYLVQAGTSCRLGFTRGVLRWHWGLDRRGPVPSSAVLRAGDLEQAQRVGQMLWDENVKSVEYRYPDSAGLCDCRYPETVPRFYTFAPVQVLKACDCYVYQSCEHEGWTVSEAKAYIDALQIHAWQALPGYEEAEWGAPKPAFNKHGGSLCQPSTPFPKHS